ncbi:MAG: hypothetical protein PHQ86_06945, partial [Dehalococcoidales bacterium]|nr:hypothetical protein [Dehalococcoidales bacterium]
MKLNVESNAFLLLKELNKIFIEHNIQAYIVGGFVRDVLLGRNTADIDIAVMADAIDISALVANVLGGKSVPLDKINGVGRIILGNRGDLSTRDIWKLDFSTVKGSIEQDLAQRDFTIDAIAVDLNQLVRDPVNILIIDPFDGWNDLQQHIIRVVAETAFKSDAARLLRAVRLVAELGFNIDKETEALIQSQS